MPATSPAAGQVATFAEHKKGVYHGAISSDGSTAYSGSDDGTVRTWDVAKGSPLRVLKAPSEKGSVSGLALSPDGATLAIGWGGDGVHLVPLGAGQTSRKLAATGEFYGLAFSRKGDLLAAAMRDKVVVWDVKDGTTRHSLPLVDEEDRSIGRGWAVAFSPDGTLLAVGAHRAGGRKAGPVAPMLRVYDLKTGKVAFTSWTTSGHVNAVTFSPDGKYLACGGEGGRIEVWNVAKRQIAKEMQVEGQVVFSADFSPDSTMLATGWSDGGIRLHEVPSGKLQSLATPGQGQVHVVRFAGKAARLLSAGSDGKAVVWDTKQMPEAPLTSPHTDTLPAAPKDMGPVPMEVDPVAAEIKRQEEQRLRLK